MVGVKKVDICNCNYAITTNCCIIVITGNYNRIVIVITHQLVVCNKFALILYYVTLYANCLKLSLVCSCLMFLNDSVDVPYGN